MTTAVKLKFSGGEALKAKLLNMSKGLERAKSVKVGFLADATYPAGDGGARLADAAKRVTPAMAAEHPDWKPRLEAWAKWQAANSPTLKVAQVAFWAEFGTTTQKPRPFFRSMIRSKSPRWGYWLGRFLSGSEYDAEKALTKLGMKVSEQLQDSIESWPADNAPLTVHIKQFNKGLTDRGIMKDHVDFEVRG